MSFLTNSNNMTEAQSFLEKKPQQVNLHDLEETIIPWRSYVIELLLHSRKCKQATKVTRNVNKGLPSKRSQSELTARMAFSKLAFLKRLSVIVFARSQLPERISCSSPIKNCLRAVMWRLSNLKYRGSNRELTTWYLQLMNRWFPFPWPLLSELWFIQRTEENLSNNIGNLHQKPESCKWTAHCRERHHPVPVNVGNQWFHHEFRVLEKSEANCLSGLDFLERHKCEPLFSRSELKLDSPHSIPFYHKNFEIDKNAIFRVVATETI